MKAAVMLKKGSPLSNDVLVVKEDIPIPTLEEDEILIRVMASSINPVDWKMVNGSFAIQEKGLVGFDLSGVIEKIAEGTVTDLKVGDQVYAVLDKTTPGSFAEYVCIDVGNASKIPNNLDFIEAASLPVVGLAALQGLLHAGKLKPGHKVCIHGGSGGVGTLAIQIAKTMGAKEIWATGSAVELIKGLGADKVINYKEESVYKALEGQQFDIIFDTVGGLAPWKAAKKGGLKKGGRYITTNGDGDDSLTKLLIRWGTRYLQYKMGLGPHYNFFRINTTPPDVTKDLKTLTKLVETTNVQPLVIPHSFELNTTSLHDMMKASMSKRCKGKLVMRIGVI